ncbi:endonuclease NucS [Ignisphaera sp. 4213-co]|uniref:Endonuclease NucS n=1 Tax=Ignisphaera cupida TaxID=3050454 RepID=A0ABD4Z518_9CREN|nr:endonuclease NucS [Ignisphaera sp. 4213-co]MDK6028401.1 endonuclease NucS [Ignisphaera sp. 4213-co]
MSKCISIDPKDSCLETIIKLNNAKSRNVIIIVGEMNIEYVGRASSYAPSGTRLLIAKPDGSLIIHEASKVEPLNWQPPKSQIHFECRDNKIFVKSSRKIPPEDVFIEINNVYLISICQLVTTKLVVIGRESDIVKMIVSNPGIIEPDAKVVGTDIATTYGKIDILLRKENGTLIVVEVKNEKAGISAALQLKRYVDFYREKGLEAKGILIAPSITSEALNFLIRENIIFIDLNRMLQLVNINNVKKLDKYIKGS